MRGNTNLDAIKERLSILDIVSNYIKLDKAGSQFRAKCPFHSEKSPSFYVSPSRGSYHCFGCGEHGDIFSFIMKIEGINFKDALRLLAEKAGISLTTFKKEETSSLIDILEQATLFFEHNFSTNSDAQNYLKKRGVSNETIQKFRIGFAPDSWRELYQKLNKAGYTDEEIVTSGLCIKHEKGLYDRFRNRVMFPIMNSSGKVVAFSGRILPTSNPPVGQVGVEPAKYVNSPETPMYHKSAILFGYNFAKQDIAKQKKVLVVEGQMDVVMSHQVGNINTVAISGTAFTPEHISIIKRFADTVVLALDTDKAGYNAMLKSAALALQNDLEVEGIKLTDKDPADMIHTHPEEWKTTVSETKPILLLISEIILEKEKIKPKQIQLLRKDLFPLLRVVRSPLLKDAYITEIAKLLSIEKNVIKQESDDVRPNFEVEERREKKITAKVDLSLSLSEFLATLQIVQKTEEVLLLEKNIRKFLDSEKEYLDGTDIETIPTSQIEKDTFKIEKQLEDRHIPKEDHEKELVKLLKELSSSLKRKIIEKKVNFKKTQIKSGIDVERNLLDIQNATRELKHIQSNFKTDL
jgi:DNA primase